MSGKEYLEVMQQILDMLDISGLSLPEKCKIIGKVQKNLKSQLPVKENELDAYDFVDITCVVS